jgi:hypothetical protein
MVGFRESLLRPPRKSLHNGPVLWGFSAEVNDQLMNLLHVPTENMKVLCSLPLCGKQDVPEFRLTNVQVRHSIPALSTA